MKITILLALVLIVNLSCSTNRITQIAEMQRDAVEEMVREDKVIGDNLPDWIYKNGMESGNLYAVGAAEFSADKSPLYIAKAALMDGETKLLSEAPADFRILTQNAMTGAGIDSAEFYQVQTKLQEVIGVTGIKHNSKKQTCRKMLRYGELSTRVTRICYVQVYAPVRELVKAYQRTLAYKFGQPAAECFGRIMDEELQKINNNPLIKRQESKYEKAIVPKPNVSKRNDTPSNSDVNAKGNGARLPATKLKKPSVKSKQVQSSNSKRRNVSTSTSKAKLRDTKSRVPTADKAGGKVGIDKQKLQQKLKSVQKARS